MTEKIILCPTDVGSIFTFFVKGRMTAILMIAYVPLSSSGRHIL